MGQPRTVKEWALGILRMVLFWYAVTAVGFPLVVLGLGHKLSEGWQFAAANLRAVAVYLALPFILSALAIMDYYLHPH